MQVLRNHITAFIIASLLAASFVLFLSKMPKPSAITEKVVVEGEQQKFSRYYLNYDLGNTPEIDLMASIANPDQITILGSSEFSNSPFASFRFLPDSFGIQSVGFGHAFHQNLSILIELLAAKEGLNNSKVCVFLSPGWFETDGTNIQAFVEFARPNFLNKILHDTLILPKYKLHLGGYIHSHYDDLDGVSVGMDGLRDLYSQQLNFGERSRFVLKKLLVPNRKKVEVNYVFKTRSKLKRQEWLGSFRNVKDQLQRDYVENIQSNEIFVNDNYFNTYLNMGNGKFDHGHMKPIDLSNSNEFNDLIMVLDLLQEQNVQASFVMQTLNPYYYKGMEENESAIQGIVQEIESRGFPCLNMYDSRTSKFQPGTLKDVMHLGDYGWMTINEFLIETYHE